MYIVILEEDIVVANTLSKLNKKLGSKLEEQEFKKVGNNRIVKLTEKDLDFVQDKKRLATIPIKNLYSKDKTHKLILYAILFFNFITFIRIG
ncbi:hypothetical protein [Sporosalibacterium faouarense]|uniref:hypothetical protein n=1 Tax=Sporosalibacterium faouarense TaxID=516123 RepID=UPI00192C3313|nr:hypothetical protein [Sporosalibacterium faouarense]